MLWNFLPDVFRTTTNFGNFKFLVSHWNEEIVDGVASTLMHVTLPSRYVAAG